MTRGELVIIAVAAIVVGSAILGTCHRKLNAKYVPAGSKVEAKGERFRSPCAEEPPQSGAVGPRDTAHGPGGLLAENRTGRAAEREVPSAASARLPRADAKMAQARLVCLFAAIRQVESSGDENPPDGDGGKAIGEYQVWRSYWQDSSVPGDYQQCRNRAYAERVVLAYWRRYCLDALDAGDWRTLAMVHHYGPSGIRCEDRHGYWAKVKENMS